MKLSDLGVNENEKKVEPVKVYCSKCIFHRYTIGSPFHFCIHESNIIIEDHCIEKKSIFQSSCNERNYDNHCKDFDGGLLWRMHKFFSSL